MKRFRIAILLCTSCDIFHSTDLPTKCSDGGCTEASAMDADGIVPFTTDSAKAFQYAQQACAWLAACESPMGHNLTGTCLADAILAYDQTINPNRAPKGAARAFWQCVFDASTKGREEGSCASVEKCVFPQGEGWTGSFVGCSKLNPTTRIDVRNGTGRIPPGEACRAQGKICAGAGGNFNAACTGPQGQSCVATGCSGYNFSYCPDGGVDLGQDCSNVGAALCVNIPDAGSGCKPETSGICSPSVNVTCDDAGVAHGCQTGFPETVACKKFAPDCIEGAYPLPQALSDACHAAAPSCTSDACNAAMLSACLRGKAVTIDCLGLGLKACTTVQTSTDGPQPACGKP